MHCFRSLQPQLRTKLVPGAEPPRPGHRRRLPQLARLGMLALALLCASNAQTRLQVTVIDRRTGQPVTDLHSGDFRVLDDRTVRPVQSAEHVQANLDLMLLVDTSLVGEVVFPLAEAFVSGLEEREQMAVVSYASSADLIQDFTSSKELLRRAIRTVKFGNTPRLVDALYAAADGGFQNTVGRKVIALLSAGVEGYSRTTERDVLKLARRNQISIFPVFVTGVERSLFERLARASGGAYFSARDLRLPPAKLANLVYTVLRGRYIVTLGDNRALGDNVRVDVTAQRPGMRLWASGMPAE